MNLTDYEIKMRVWKEDSVYVIEAEDFPLVTQGRTFQEAVDNFADAFKLNMEDPEFKQAIEKFRLKTKEQSPILSQVALDIQYAQTTRTIRQRTNQTF